MKRSPALRDDIFIERYRDKKPNPDKSGVTYIGFQFLRKIRLSVEKIGIRFNFRGDTVDVRTDRDMQIYPHIW
jgi:hypothetical protein